MKIAFVYDFVYPFTIGGGEKRNWEIASRLARQGHDVWVLGMQFWDGDQHLVREGVNLFGVSQNYQVFDSSGRRSMIQPLLFAKGLFRHLGSHQYDVIDCSSFPYLPSLAIWLRYLPHPAPLTINWFEARGPKGWWNYQGWRGMLAVPFEWFCSRITPFNTSISELTVQQAKDRLGFTSRRMELLSCGVDYDVYARYHDRAKTPQILYAGRLVRHKRVDMLLKAFAKFSAKHPEFKLKIIGTGDRLNALQASAENLGIQGKTEWISRVTEDELHTAFAESMVFVMPSEQEGFGLVIVEAMAAGTPVVALERRDSAARYLIQHRTNGWLAADIDAIEEGMTALSQDPVLYQAIRRNALASARDFDWGDSIVPRAMEHYEAVVEGTRN